MVKGMGGLCCEECTIEPRRITVHKTVVERLTKEFGDPHTTLRWTIQPTAPGRNAINVQVDEDRGDSCKTVRVWVFNPATGAAGKIHEEIACDGDIDRVIARIRRELEGSGEVRLS